VRDFSVILEPIDTEYTSFILHVRARGKGGGTLHTARGEPREWKKVNTALSYIRRVLKVDDVLVLLKPRKRDANDRP
jgi:hypothetical protein